MAVGGSLSSLDARGPRATTTAGEPGRDLVVRAGPVPAVELDGFHRQLHLTGGREPVEDGLQRHLLGDAAVHRLLAAEAGRELQRLATVLAEARKRRHQEV